MSVQSFGRRSRRGQMRSGEKAVAFWPSLRRLLSMMKPERTLFIAVVVMGSLSVLTIVVGPWLLGQATDVIFAGVVGSQLEAGQTVDEIVAQLRAKGHHGRADFIAGIPHLVPGQGVHFGLLSRWLVTAAAAFGLGALLEFGQNFLLNRAVQRTVYRLRDATHAKLDRLPLSFYDRQPRGELLSRITNDSDNVSQTLQQTMGQLLSGALTIIGVLVMMTLVSPLLTLITIATLPFAAYFSVKIGQRAQAQFAETWKQTGRLNAQIEESYTAQALVKVYGRIDDVNRLVADTNEQLYQANFKAQFISSLIRPVNLLVGNINYVLVAVIGAIRVASGAMPLGSVQAFIQYCQMFTRPITQVASMTNLLQSGVASAERIFEVLDAEEMIPATENTFDEPVHGHVKFEDISFSYDPDVALIQHLNLEARPGDAIAIVGQTGAGKTTLVNLIERFYELDQGRITIDGTDIASVSRQNLRSKLGMVLQDTWLFTGTVADNIAYGKHDATWEDIEVAARAARVDDFVRSLPDGYDTMIDDDGANLSAGEKQLLTIARAFIADPEVLILDEATSNVDTRTEVLVQQAMANLRRGRTSFIIAHRLSTIRDADTIVVMSNGTIVEQGNHDQLMALEGEYYDLFQSQFAGEVT